MSTKRPTPRPNARPIVAAFTHEETYALARAAEAFAATLDVVDKIDPSLERRALAEVLRRLQDQLTQANAGRSFIEGES
jgi:hypothetical protein